MNRWTRVSGLCFTLLGMLVTSEAAQYRIVDLGKDYAAYGINDNGDIACYNRLTTHVCILRNGVEIDLGPGRASSINSLGDVMGWQCTTGPSPSHACIWVNGVMSDLGTLGGDAFANAANDSRQVVGTCASYYPFIWQNGTMAHLPKPSHSLNCGAEDINNRGEIVGWAYYDYGGAGAIMWKNGLATDLGGPAGLYYSYAVGINNVGQVVGWSRTTDGPNRAILWQNGTATYLSTLGHASCARAINDNGLIIGYSLYINDDSRACIWQNGEVTDLGTLGGRFSSAVEINNFGCIVGYAFDANQISHAVMWVPVPEPSSIVCLLIGVGGIGSIKLRRKSA